MIRNGTRDRSHRSTRTSIGAFGPDWQPVRRVCLCIKRRASLCAGRLRALCCRLEPKGAKGAHGRRKGGATIRAARQGSHLVPCSSPRGHLCATEGYQGSPKKRRLSITSVVCGQKGRVRRWVKFRLSSHNPPGLVTYGVVRRKNTAVKPDTRPTWRRLEDQSDRLPLPAAPRAIRERKLNAERHVPPHDWSRKVRMASCNATRTTLVGSMIPAATKSLYSPDCASYP
jgi:hypothetical protein